VQAKFDAGFGDPAQRQGGNLIAAQGRQQGKDRRQRERRARRRDPPRRPRNFLLEHDQTQCR